MTPLQVSVFSDYICPFCYIGSERLFKLEDEFELSVEWLYFEIHPETPAEGMSLEKLGYDPDHWQRLMQSLLAMAAQDGIDIAERMFTTNSHKAMLLAEAAKARPEAFARLHRQLFRSFFAERLNIGDEQVLRNIAAECGVEDTLVDSAWTDTVYEQRLKACSAAALKLGVNGVPAYIMGEYYVPGAASIERLRAAARAATAVDGKTRAG